jgi:hypothetical protein
MVLLWSQQECKVTLPLAACSKLPEWHAAPPQLVRLLFQNLGSQAPPSCPHGAEARGLNRTQAKVSLPSKMPQSSMSLALGITAPFSESQLAFTRAWLSRAGAACARLKDDDRSHRLDGLDYLAFILPLKPEFASPSGAPLTRPSSEGLLDWSAHTCLSQPQLSISACGKRPLVRHIPLERGRPSLIYPLDPS